MKKVIKPFLIIALLGISILVRYIMLSRNNVDLEHYLVPWYNYIIDHGGFVALKDAFYNYSPPYMYLLVAVTPLKGIFTEIASIKLISICFDYAAAWALFRLVRLKHPGNNLPWFAFFGVLFAPTVFINSAYWGQCDVIYCTFLLGCVYFCCTRKYQVALVCFGSAFAFKAQAIFLSPLILILFLNGSIPWRNIFILPITYFLWIVPSLIVGYPLGNALGTYFNQADTYHWLTANAPNIYMFIPTAYYDYAVPIGSGLSTIVCGYLVWFVVKSKSELDGPKIIFLSVLFSTLLPFILPKMHDRYFYFAALLSIGLAFYRPKWRLAPLVLQGSSIISYTYFLQGNVYIPVIIPILLNFFLVAALLIFFFREYGNNKIPHSMPD